MERGKRTSDTLRGLVRDLDQKLEETRHSSLHEPEVIHLPNDGLVIELDKKLQDRPAYREPEIIPPRFSDRVPTWLGFVLVTLLGVALAVVVVQPWQPRCGTDDHLCQIALLDVDALRVAIPDSAVMQALPNIDALDPDDVLTVGDIFAMERFSDIDFEELITDEDIERLLGASG